MLCVDSSALSTSFLPASLPLWWETACWPPVPAFRQGAWWCASDRNDVVSVGRADQMFVRYNVGLTNHEAVKLETPVEIGARGED